MLNSMTVTDDTQESLNGKSGHLLLCGGGICQVFSRNGIKPHVQWGEHRSSQPNKPKADDLLTSLQHKMLNQHSKQFSGTNSLNKNRLCGEIREDEILSHKCNLPRRVKVIVYTKTLNPYLVLFDSDNKYAVPIAYLKLGQYDVTAVDEKQFIMVRRSRAQDSGTMKNFNSILFQAHSEFARNNWMELLQPLSRKQEDCCLAPCRPKKRLNVNHNFLPVLWEDDENEDPDRIDKRLKTDHPPHIQTNSLNITRHNSFGKCISLKG